jgi:hypothetical protein
LFADTGLRHHGVFFTPRKPGAMRPVSAMVKLRHFGAAAAVSPGGKILNVKIDTFSPGLNGPGTWLLTAGMLRRYATTAATSSLVM